MAPLLAADGAKFRFRIEETDSQFRAAYLVSLDMGARFHVQNEVHMFGSASEAEAWVRHGATNYRFLDIRHF